MRYLPESKAQRRFQLRFILICLFHVGLLFLAEEIFHRLHPTGPVAWLVASLPALPILAMLAVSTFYFSEETDEFERTVVIEALLWGVGGLLIVTTCWGILESFLPVTHLPIESTAILYFICVGISAPIIRLRYS